MSDSESETARSDNEEENENPYPLEGKYTDEEDRERCVSTGSQTYVHCADISSLTSALDY
jgi:hypothetical protein